MAGNTRREFYTKRLAQKQIELAAIESQLPGTLSKVDEVKLNLQAEQILQEIDDLEKKLLELEAKDDNPNRRYLNLEKSFQKIDFSEARRIAESINNRFGNNSGAVLFFLQRSTKQKGDYCIREILDLIVSDRKIGEEIIGDFRRYPIDLDSSISEFNRVEFSTRLASYLSPHLEGSLPKIIKNFCSSLRGGSTIFIRIDNWDGVIEREKFLDWFIKDFWQTLLQELAFVFKNFSKIRFIVVLVSKRIIFSNCSSLPLYFCTENTFDPCKIIELPLSDWTVEDIRNWLINVRGLSNLESKQLAWQIYQESEGTPDTICSILEREFRV